MDLIRIISSKVVFLHLFYDDQALVVDHGLCYSTQLLILYMGKPNIGISSASKAVSTCMHRYQA